MQFHEQSKKKASVLFHLSLEAFKVEMCLSKQPHNHKQCIYFHSMKDRRRPGTFYVSEMCEFAEAELVQNCPFGDLCPKSHNKVESLYTLDKYKKKFCTLYPNKTAQCEYGIYCSFAHDEQDSTAELIHNLKWDADFYIFYYKTVWCPYNYINHDRSFCVYAHNWQDYRRKPNMIQYEASPCAYWKPNEFITKYESACPNSFNCLSCHGWKELEYHPLIYKSRLCMSETCQKTLQCPYFHSQQDKMNLSEYIRYGFSRPVPRNRIVSGTFKQERKKLKLKGKGSVSSEQQYMPPGLDDDNNCVSNS